MMDITAQCVNMGQLISLMFTASLKIPLKLILGPSPVESAYFAIIIKGHYAISVPILCLLTVGQYPFSIVS